MDHFLRPVIFGIFFTCNSLLAQDTTRSMPVSDDFDEQIVTDRPDQTEAPQLTPKGWLQVETGAQREYDDDATSKQHSENTLYSTTLWKYGLTRNFELRLITEYGEDKKKYKPGLTDKDTVVSQSGLKPVAVGSKIAIQQEHGMIPKISLIGHLFLPYFGSDDFRPEYIAPKFRFVFSNHLGKHFNLSYNLGMEWEDKTRAGTGIYTLSLETIFTDRFSIFIESYGFLREKENPDHRLDGGLMYLITNNVQFDCSAGIGLNPWSPDYFVSAGLSFRVNAFDKLHR